MLLGMLCKNKSKKPKPVPGAVVQQSPSNFQQVGNDVSKVVNCVADTMILRKIERINIQDSWVHAKVSKMCFDMLPNIPNSSLVEIGIRMAVRFRFELKIKVIEVDEVFFEYPITIGYGFVRCSTELGDGINNA